jgi:integrase
VRGVFYCIQAGQDPTARRCAYIDLGIINGKRKYLYGTTRREVAEKLKTMQHTQASGANLAAERITVKQFLERWLSEIVTLRNKPRTVDGYTQIVGQHLIPHLGRYQLDQLRPEHVQAMLNTLAACPTQCCDAGRCTTIQGNRQPG